LFRIDEIFKSEETKHRLTLFKTEYIKWLETQLFEKTASLIYQSGSSHARIQRVSF